MKTIVTLACGRVMMHCESSTATGAGGKVGMLVSEYK